MRRTVAWAHQATVPASIVGTEFTAQHLRGCPHLRRCRACLSVGHPPKARFCSDCGTALLQGYGEAGAD